MNDLLKQLNRTTNYRCALERQSTARAQNDADSYRLELRNAEVRNAELASQAFEHVSGGKLKERLGEISEREREIGIAFARYAMYGRTDEA